MSCRTLVALLALIVTIPSLAAAQTPQYAPPRTTVAVPTPQMPASFSTPILDRIRAAHALNCAVSKEEEDYSRAQDHGNRAAFDLDLCKAAAVAVLGPGAHFNIHAYPDEDASLVALQQGEVDLVASASHTFRFASYGILFSRPVLFDGQGFLFKNNPGIHSPLDLAGKKICFVIETPSESGLRRYAEDHHIAYIWYPFSEEGEMYAAFFGGNCAAITSDVTKLANVRNIARKEALDYTVLTELITQDPLAYASLSTDPVFAAVLDWTMATLVNAEALHITAATAGTLATSPDTRVLNTLGQRFGPGTALGLDAHWGANVIQAAGNYGELYERDLGSGSPLHLDRGENKLTRDGGLMVPVFP